MRRRLVTVLITAMILSVAGSILAGDAGRETPFVSLGVGARSLGMGGSYAALANDALAIHYNPAGLAGLEFQEVAFMHSLLFAGSTYDFASWVYPITEDHGLGAGIMRIGTNDIIRRVDFAERGSFGYSFTQMLLAYGRNVGKGLAGGMALEIFQQSLDNRSDFGMGLDLGLRMRLWKRVRFGAAVHEILQHKLTLLERAEKTSPVIVAGLSWPEIMISDRVQLTASLDFERHDGRELKVRAGAEVLLHDALALRMGYDRDNLALGTGLKTGRIRVDYAYKLVDYTDGIHHVSLSFLLGMSTTEKIKLRELAKLPPEPTEEEKRFAALMDTANHFFRRFQLDSASAYFHMALDMQPGNGEIIGTLAAIEEARRVQQAQEEALRAAREDVSQTLKSFVAQAEQMLSQKMYSAALDVLELIFDIDPANADANQLRNRILVARDTELATDLDNARLAADSSRWLDALEGYNRVLELDPENAAGQQGKRQVLATMGLPEKVRIGIEMYDKGELNEARSRFQAVLDVNPDEPTALEYLRRIRERLAGQPAATLEDLQKDRIYWELYLEGLRHMRNKEYQRAIEVWEKVLQAYPNNANTLNNIEQARLRLGTQGTEK